MNARTLQTTWYVEHGPDTLNARPTHEYESLQDALSFIFYESAAAQADSPDGYARLLCNEDTVATFSASSDGPVISEKAEPLIADAWAALLEDG